MSRLIFEGDTVSRFGKSIPTPFIEKIKIYENDIVADIAIYLHITDDDEINQSIYEDLSNLELYAGLGVIYRIPDRLELGTVFELVSDNIYNNEGQRFAKFMYSRNSIDREMQDFSASDRAISIRSIYYSCFIAIAKDEDSTLNKELHSFKEVNQFDREGLYSVYKNFSSPLIYEKVFSQRVRRSAPQRLATEPIVIYEDSSGVPYENTPLESIQRNYYKTTDNFRILLKDQLQGIVDTFSGTQSQQAQSFVDSISFIAETKNADVDFIVELDKLRNSFPSRTSTSELGLLYNQLKTILFAANDTLILGEPVTKKLVPNTKIIDLRNLALIQVEEWSRRNTETYEPRVDDTGDILYSNVLMERQQLEIQKTTTGTQFNGGDVTTGTITYDSSGTLLDPNFDLTSIFGYFFFDYEKALHKKSNISQIYEVQKLLNIFGNNAIDRYFSLKRTEMIRFLQRDLIRKISTPYVENRPLTHLVLATEGIGGRVVYKVVEKKENDAGDGVEEVTTIPYVIPRGFDTVVGLDGYRLMAFEFQDFEDDVISLERGGSYRFNVFVNDDTLDFYDLMVEIYEQSLSDLLSYLSQAEDFCSYNNIDGRFNDFFVKAIKEQFLDEDSYPWLRAPKIFAIHTELINNRFDGNLEIMSFYASNLSANVSPENGTLLALSEFAEQMQTFYDTYYGEDGIITRIVSSRRNTEGLFDTSLRDNIEFIATLGFDDLPDVIDTTVDVAKPTRIRLTDGNMYIITENDSKYFIDSRVATIAMGQITGRGTEEFLERYGGRAYFAYINATFRALEDSKKAARNSRGSISDAGPPVYFSDVEGLPDDFRAIENVSNQVDLIIESKKKFKKKGSIFIKFINTLIRNIKSKQSTVMGYNERVSLIDSEAETLVNSFDTRGFNLLALDYEDNRNEIIDICLVALASEKDNLYNVTQWYANKTKHVRRYYSPNEQ
jgi:hypothetical protein